MYNNKTYERTNGNFIEQYSIKRIKEKITCDTCNHYIPVNKITNSVECSLCGSENKLNLDFWNRAINRGSFEKLKCEECNTEYDINDILYAIKNNTALACKKCGVNIKYRILPDECISKNKFKIIGVFNEILTKTDTNISSEIIKLECSNCGAPLETDGKSKIIKCNFCGTNNMLSQVAQLHLVPLKAHSFCILTLDRKWNPVEEEEKKEQEQKIKIKKARIKEINKLIQGHQKKIRELKVDKEKTLKEIHKLFFFNKQKEKKLKKDVNAIDEKISKISKKINQYNKERNLIK